MKRILYLISVCFLVLSCENSQNTEFSDKQIIKKQEVKEAPDLPASQKEYFAIESANIKYKNIAAGQEMIRDWWFDKYGNQQYEETYMVIMGEKTGSKSLVIDGMKYVWDFDSSIGTKSNYNQPVTDYNNISEREIKRYGIEKHGYEDILGKRCLVVTTEKLAKSKTWVWENIPLKTEAVFNGNKVIMEAIEINTGNVDCKIFELPTTVIFSERK